MSIHLQKITHLSLDRFPDKTDDERNVTPTTRSFDHYIMYINAIVPSNCSITKFIKERSKEVGGKIRVLDCGAGQGVALDTLLESKYGNLIKKVTGVSLHSFNHVKSVLTKHTNRIEWYLGDAIEVLPKLPAEYDLLTDIFASFTYSLERVKVIISIHSVLKLGGRAYIRCAKKIKNTIDENGQRVNLGKYISQTYPETFQLFRSDAGGVVLIINKTSIRCPLPEYTSVSFRYMPVYSRLSKDEAIKGNAWFPRNVTYKRTSAPNSLRILDNPT